MESYKLSFGTIQVLDTNVSELIVHEGVVMTDLMVKEFHNFLLDNLETPYLVIINKKNSYSYTFQAQKNIGNLKELKAIAIVVNTSGGYMTAETLIDLNKDDNWNICLFQKREDALDWLKFQAN